MARIASALETWQSMGGALGRSETRTTWCFCGYPWVAQVSEMDVGQNGRPRGPQMLV